MTHYQWVQFSYQCQLELKNQSNPSLELTVDSPERCMGLLRLVGSLKLWVSFAEYCPFYRALLQKRPVILRSLLIEAPP